MANETPSRAKMEVMNDAINRETMPALLAPFDPNDPNPLATLLDARNRSFRIVAQCQIEPQLINLDFALRAYLNLRSQGVTDAWTQVVAAGESDEGPSTFISDADRFHEQFDIKHINPNIVRGAARPVHNEIQDLTNHTLLALFGLAEPLREASPGLVLYEDGPKPAHETTAAVESLLARKGVSERMQRVFQITKERVLREAETARTNFSIGLATASHTAKDKPQLTERTRRLQGTYVARVNPLLERIATDLGPDLTDRQRTILPKLTRIFRVNPPPHAGI